MATVLDYMLDFDAKEARNRLQNAASQGQRLKNVYQSYQNQFAPQAMQAALDHQRAQTPYIESMTNKLNIENRLLPGKYQAALDLARAQDELMKKKAQDYEYTALNPEQRLALSLNRQDSAQNVPNVGSNSQVTPPEGPLAVGLEKVNKIKANLPGVDGVEATNPEEIPGVIPKSSIGHLMPGDQFLAIQHNNKIVSDYNKSQAALRAEKRAEFKNQYTDAQKELIKNVAIGSEMYKNILVPLSQKIVSNDSSGSRSLIDNIANPLSSLPKSLTPGSEQYNLIKNYNKIVFQIAQNLLKGSSGTRAQQAIKQEFDSFKIGPFTPLSTIKAKISAMGDVLAAEAKARSKTTSASIADLKSFSSQRNNPNVNVFDADILRFAKEHNISAEQAQYIIKKRLSQGEA